jgi:2'-5' RNA ligase
MPRLFIAIDLPGDVKRSLGCLRLEIRGARRVPPEQLHLTLAFLGEQGQEMVERLKGELSAIRSPGFRLCFSTLGGFPSHRNPRVIWAGLEPEARLERLASRVRAAVLACGVPLEERTFTPHVTLARVKQPAEYNVTTCLRHDQRPVIPPFTAVDFILYESRLTPSGAIHTTLATFPLQPV